jgi:uncharacterized protein YqjF (DUF2071 family)
VPSAPTPSSLVRLAGDVGEAVLRAGIPWAEAAAQSRVTGVSRHRPWPLPDAPWLQAQTWRDLLFAHWAVPPEALRPAVPAQIPIDTFGGSAWIGITPFEVSGLRLRGSPPPPLLSRFPETNVRTYTTLDGRPGIWFLSLDAASALAVAAARRSYRLPYFRARMSVEPGPDRIRYRTRRSAPPASLALEYGAAGDVFHAAAGTVEHFLTERYCLYALDEQQRVLRADIHHAPWPLQLAEAEIRENSMTAPYGIALPAEPPLLHFSRRQDVVIWPLRAHVSPSEP